METEGKLRINSFLDTNKDENKIKKRTVSNRRSGLNTKPLGEHIFNFLVNAGFASILPFFPIILNDAGFTYSKIGYLFGFSQFIWFFGNILWRRTFEKVLSWQKPLMMLSILSWLVLLSPVVLFELIDCEKIPLAGSHDARPINSAMINNRSINDVISHHNIWSKNATRLLNKEFITSIFLNIRVNRDDFILAYITIFAIFSSITCISAHDYNSNHHRSAKTNISRQNCILMISDSNQSPDLLITSNLPIAMVTVIMAFLFTKLDICDVNFGGYKVSYFALAIFEMLALMILQFLGNDEKHASDTSVDNIQQLSPNQNQKNKRANAVLYPALFILGTVDAWMSAFLYLRMRSSAASYLCIATVFASKKASETIFHALNPVIKKKLSFSDTVVIYSAINTSRCLLAWMATGDATWYLVCTELAAGFGLIMHVMLKDLQQTQRSDMHKISCLNTASVAYWAIGKVTGCMAGGILMQKIGAEVTMLGASGISIIAAVIVAIVSFC